MARPRTDKSVEQIRQVSLTTAIVNDFKCPADKAEDFLRDLKTPGLVVRVTSSGHKTYCFERKVQGKTKRKKISEVRVCPLDKARTIAREAYHAYEQGIDFFEARQREQAERSELEKRDQVKAFELWDKYVEVRRQFWSERNYKDVMTLSRKGGGFRPRAPKVNGERAVLQDGLLYSLLQENIKDWSHELLQEWARKHFKHRRGQLRLAARHLKAFLRWCREQPEFEHLVPRVDDIIKTSTMTSYLGKPKDVKDSILREDLQDFFEKTSKFENSIVGGYLQVMLLTGARPNEILNLKWGDIHRNRRYIYLSDKVKKERYIPLTPYVEKVLFEKIPQRSVTGSEYVFHSPYSQSGRLSPPNKTLHQLCKESDMNPCTLHGLRRTFASLAEWMDDGPPNGVVAQIMGHAPSGTAEKHYKVRPMDLLRKYHTMVERFMLVEAGLNPDALGLPEYQCDAVIEAETDIAKTAEDIFCEGVESSEQDYQEPTEPTEPTETAEPVQIILPSPPAPPAPPAAAVKPVFEPEIDHELFFGKPVVKPTDIQQGSLF